MDNLDTQVLDAARRWVATGHRFALITVARTWGSAPRPVGAWMALRDDGLVQGSVSGGCIETSLVERMLAGEFGATLPFSLHFGVTQDDAQRYGLPCGGSMELVVEPSPDVAVLETLADRTAAGHLVKRCVTIGREAVVLADGTPGENPAWDGETLSTLHGPLWRLLVIGAGQISRYLAQMAQALDYQVFVCDPRTEYAEEWNVPGVALLPGMPDDVVIELRLDPHTAVVALTHDPKLDDMALLDALKTPAFYVGALGSQVNNDKRRQRLMQYFDFSPAEVNRLHGPVGLPIGSRTPPEIALSILAEMTAVRSGAWTVQGLRPRTSRAVDGCGVG